MFEIASLVRDGGAPRCRTGRAGASGAPGAARSSTMPTSWSSRCASRCGAGPTTRFAPLLRSRGRRGGRVGGGGFLLTCSPTAAPAGPLGRLQVVRRLCWWTARRNGSRRSADAADRARPAAAGAEDTDDFLVAVDRVAGAGARGRRRRAARCATRRCSTRRISASCTCIPKSAGRWRRRGRAQARQPDRPRHRAGRLRHERCRSSYRRRRGLPPGGAEAVGGKALNLSRMAEAGLPVPPAFVLPTSWCRALRAARPTRRRWRRRWMPASPGWKRRPAPLRRRAAAAAGSVRSGAAVSMPGMLETVLDVGMNRPPSRACCGSPATRAWPGTATAGWCRAMPRWSRPCRSAPFDDAGGGAGAGRDR